MYKNCKDKKKDKTDKSEKGYKLVDSSIVTVIKRPARDACLCMGELQAQPAPAAPTAPPAPHFVFLISL